MSHRDLLMEIVDEPEDAFDTPVKDEGFKAIDDQSPRAVLIQEGRRHDLQLLKPPGIDRPDPAVDGRDLQKVPAIGDGGGPSGRHPEEARAVPGQGAEEGRDRLVGV